MSRDDRLIHNVRAMATDFDGRAIDASDMTAALTWHQAAAELRALIARWQTMTAPDTRRVAIRAPQPPLRRTETCQP